jgi:uncharacterized protein
VAEFIPLDGSKGRALEHEYYRVLALDGGGLKGLFAASFLAALEENLDEPLVRYFDLIVGTSTGGIIALGLGAGLKGKEIAAFYETKGALVFGPERLRRFRSMQQLFRTKYGAQPLKKELEGILGEKRLGESIIRLVIPSVNVDTGEVYLFKTAHHPRFEKDYKQKMVDVALATASAPLYLPPHRGADGGLLLDGGLWANNPVGVAAVEAVGILDWPRDRVRILSIGNTGEPLDAGAARRKWGGFAGRTRRIFDLALRAQSQGSIGTAVHLVGKDNVFRIDPVVPADRFGFDSSRESSSLKGLAASECRKALPSLRPAFFRSTAAEFEPFRRTEGPAVGQ